MFVLGEEGDMGEDGVFISEGERRGEKGVCGRLKASELNGEEVLTGRDVSESPETSS